MKTEYTEVLLKGVSKTKDPYNMQGRTERNLPLYHFIEENKKNLVFFDITTIFLVFYTKDKKKQKIGC